MNRIPIEPGRVVRSTAGRDEGRLFVIISQIDADFALTVDGALRTMARPKKKRCKHLKATGALIELPAGRPPTDAEIRSWLNAEPDKEG